MADKKKMSVAEILAAARQQDSGEGDATPSPAEAAPAAEEVVESAASAESPPAEEPAPATTMKPGERPSVKDILAMARSGESGAATKPAAPKAKAAAEKPAAAAKPKAPAAKKPAAKKEVAERKTTASILAAARRTSKAGPMSKAEAAKQPAAKPKAPPKPKRPVPPMPEKPAYAIPVEPPEVDQSRRTAMKAAGVTAIAAAALFGSALRLGFTSLATTLSLWGLATARFMFPNILTEPPSRFKVGFPDSFSPGVVETKFKAQFGVWVVNGSYRGEQQLYALSTVCTHLGCTPNWLEAEQKFKCPCHGSGFYKDGINFEGPAPRPLERYAIRIADDGQVEIDKSRRFQEEMGQWSDPASFVSV